MTDRSKLRVLGEGKFARLVADGHWEWVERINTSGAAAIMAITAEQEVVLIDQYRIPLGARVIELPAGLVGDTAEFVGEPLIEAARRELLEETGYEGPQWRLLFTGPSSAGLTSETYSLFLVRDAKKVGPGGGDGSEDIRVVVVPLDRIDAWLDGKRRDGVLIDPKIYMGLYFARQG
jgi:ADP-ribose pyrophosphatase